MRPRQGWVAEISALLTSYQKVFDNAPDLVLVLRGREHVIEYANPAYRRFVGERVLEGRRYREALADVAGQGYADLLDQVVRSGEPFVGREMPTAMQRPGEAAEVRYFDFVYQPLTGADGEVEGVIGQLQDVTDRVQARAAQRASEERLALAARAAGIGVWEWRLDTDEMIYSPEAKQICGFHGDAPVTLEQVVASTHPDDFPTTWAQSVRARDPAIRDTTPYEYRIVRPDGEVRWVLAHGQAVFEARGGAEVATRYVGTLIDITERKLAEQGLAASEQRLTLALNAGRMAIWQVEPDDMLIPNAALCALLGLADARPLRLAELAPNFRLEDLAAIREAVAQAQARAEPFFTVEFLYRLPSGEMRWFESRAEVRDGTAGSAIGVIVDITERKAAEERLRLLAREVDHRANNLMTVIQGAVRLSHARDVEQLRESLSGRLQALARAHQLLSDTRWEGADLRRLVQEELLAFTLDDHGRCRAGGPDVALPPAAAQAAAMAIHELATNAVKYGALSVEAGAVDVAWRVEGGQLRLTWRERGGPRVRPPTRLGFGATVISRALDGIPGGATRLDWRPEGLVAEFELALQGALGPRPVEHELHWS